MSESFESVEIRMFDALLSDEERYLLSSPINAARLREAMESPTPAIAMTWEEVSAFLGIDLDDEEEFDEE